MTPELIYVTGGVGVVPGTAHAARVRQAMQVAASQKAEVYVLGSLFAPGVGKDDMLTYLEDLPGRLILLVGQTDPVEARLAGWHYAAAKVELSLWGMRFLLHPAAQAVPEGIMVHATPGVQDSGTLIDAHWNAWDSRFGPGGLHSLYALGILAGQYATGMAAPEPVDG